MKLAITIICYIIALIFGIYAQSLAYFLADFTPFEPFPILIALTLISFALYIFSITYYLVRWKKQHPSKLHDFVIAAFIIFALPVMGFSFIVCMFWWG